MTENAPAEKTWGELGPAMRALPNDRWRLFVMNLVTGKQGQGAQVNAYRAAGYGGTQKTQIVQAHRLSRDERVIAAIAEECRKLIRVGHPEAVNALFAMIRDASHRDHARAVGMLLDRVDPVTVQQNIAVTHRHESPDQEALEELRALRALNVTREKLIEVFGGNYLPRLERLEAAASDKAKVIDAVAVEVEVETS